MSTPSWVTPGRSAYRTSSSSVSRMSTRGVKVTPRVTSVGDRPLVVSCCKAVSAIGSLLRYSLVFGDYSRGLRLDRDLARLGRLGLRQRQAEHAVLVARLNLVGVHHR